MLKRLLAYPSARGLDIDSPETTEIRAKIIQEKIFLNRIYDEWYQMLIDRLPKSPGAIVELGSGGGFLSTKIKGLIATDILPLKHMTLAADGMALPFQNFSIRALVMVNVLHHMSDPEKFFSSAAAATKPDGVIVMIEPWKTPWSAFVYKYFHNETIDPNAREWAFASSGPLSGSNIALPWIIFVRDKARFNERFPEWEIKEVLPFMPFRYLLSGGVSFRALMPDLTFGFWKKAEALFFPFFGQMGMFARIVLIRR